MDIISLPKLANADFFDDFASILNKMSDCLTEFAFAEKGGSMFNRAIYVEEVKPSFLRELSLHDGNVAFLTDCQKDKINATINQITYRQAKNEFIISKGIISFDIDFKSIQKDFLSMPAINKFNFAIAYSERLINKIHQNNIPLWVINYSGNGLHLHFKLSSPFIVINPQHYALATPSGASAKTPISGLRFKVSFPASAHAAARSPAASSW